MKVTLLVTELFFVPVVMDQLPEVYLGSASDQRRAEAWRCSNLPDVVYWIFFRNSLSNSLRNINKLLVQLRNYPSTTKSYFYTFATFSTLRSKKLLPLKTNVVSIDVQAPKMTYLHIKGQKWTSRNEIRPSRIQILNCSEQGKYQNKCCQ